MKGGKLLPANKAKIVAVLDFATHGRYLHWLHLKHWKTLWKSNNEQAH